MARAPAEDLETFIACQPASALASVLLELAKEHEAVRKRLERLRLADRPDKRLETGLAACFVDRPRVDSENHPCRSSGSLHFRLGDAMLHLPARLGLELDLV